MTLPTFVIVGAMKSGTTSLHRYLGQHPDVFVTKKKELHYFADQRQQGLDWYESHFAEGAGYPARGESSTSFTKLPSWPDATARLAELIPEAKLIYVMRNPVDRTFSHYSHTVRQGQETLPFSRALVEVPRYLEVSHYSRQLRGLDEHFPRDQIALVSHERLEREPQAVLVEVLDFLGLRTDVEFDATRRWNETAQRLAERGAELPSDPWITVNRPEPVRPRRGRWPGRRTEAPPPSRTSYQLTAPAREFIAATLADDVEALGNRWPDMPAWPDFAPGPIAPTATGSTATGFKANS